MVGRDGLRRVDAHLHVWSLGGGRYGWLDESFGPIFRDIGIEEAELGPRAAGIDAIVLVQAEDSLADTALMLDAADHSELVAGVVGWVPLDDPDATARVLEHRDGRLRGIRHLTHNDPRADFLLLPDVHASLRLVAAAGLAYDIPNEWPMPMGHMAGVADAVLELTVVVDHLAKPPRPRDDHEHWAKGLRDIASRANTVAKVSGLRMPGEPYDVAAVRPSWDVALECFGPGRLMLGSDWPMTVAEGGYAPTWSVLETLAAELSPVERGELLAGTAERVYRV